MCGVGGHGAEVKIPEAQRLLRIERKVSGLHTRLGWEKRDTQGSKQSAPEFLSGGREGLGHPCSQLD